MRHIFYIPASYAALIYGILTGTGLLLALYIALVNHPKEVLITACGRDHYEFWPSISTTIGDVMPERQVWRVSFVLCCPFRLGTTITIFYVFWQKGTGGMTDIYSLRSSLRQFLSSSAFLTLLALWVDLWRLIGAVVWTMTASNESLAYHNMGFAPYVFLCFVMQVVLTILVKRNRYNLSIYPVQKDGQISYIIKRFCMYGEAVASAGVVLFFLRHFATCAPGSFSISTVFEWSFALFNIVFDMSAWYDLHSEGWWLSGSPEFFRGLWATRTTDPVAPRLGGETATGIGSARQVSLQPGANHHRFHGSDADVAAAAMAGDGNSSGGTGETVHESGEAPTTAPPDTTGEYFIRKDIILHRFTFCSAPSRLSMWLCDIYWSHFFFEMMVHLIEHMYFMPLVAMSVSWEVSAIVVFGAVCLLRIPRFRRWATGPCYFARTYLKPNTTPPGASHRVVPMYVFFYFMASLSHLHMLILRNAGAKILVIAVGPLFMTLAIITRFLYPSTATPKSASADSNEDSRRTLYMMPLGLVLCMLLRILYLSLSPMFTEAFYSGLYGIVLGIAFTTIIYRHAMFGNTLKDSSRTATCQGLLSASDEIDMATTAVVVASDACAAKAGGMGDIGGSGDGSAPSYSLSQRDELAPNTVSALAMTYNPASHAILGALFGLLTSFSLTFLTCANYIPRLIAIDPYPASVIVVLSFVAGLYYSPDVLPLSPHLLQLSKHRLDGVRRVLRIVFAESWRRFGALLMLGCSLMLFATRQSNFVREIHHPDYPVTDDIPEEKVSLKFWRADVEFWGSKHLSFLGGLLMVFCIGTLFPVVMELGMVHLRARRLAALADALDTNAVFRRESNFFLSFEVLWVAGAIGACAPYVLTISYPFIPYATIMRERSRSVIFFHVLSLLLLAWHAGRRVRGVKAPSIGDAATARKQRTMQGMVTIVVLVAILAVVISRVALQPEDVSFPEDKKTALQFPEEVLHLHEMLIRLRIDRNTITDSLLKEYEREFHKTKFESIMEEMDKNITKAKTGTEVDPKFKLGHLSNGDRLDVWQAAKAMTFFSGMIWTVHFGLDNFGVDSFNRMAQEAQLSKAGVVGLLESDSMHLTNGNRDMVEHMSYNLGFRYTDYGPTSLDNTYGCALITRYPIKSVRRYIAPSPLGELCCIIHAKLDVFGILIDTYVGHFGNTNHWADGLLQSEFLGQLALTNPGPSMWLGYLVTYPGNLKLYHHYTDPAVRGLFRDAGLDMYVNRPWVRLHERGGFDEEPVTTDANIPEGNLDFNVEYKLPFVQHLELQVLHPDASFRRPPADKPPRHFYYNMTNRYSLSHPRYEFVDRYCQYCLYKTGAAQDEEPANADKLQPFQVELFDWWRKVDGGVENLSDTEIQVIQLRFHKRES